ncbi:nicotinate-nucleotide adenylyltransferase [Thioflexithrix psekupsensis]|uniref:Probable nicotinate-nucleotide adenylyltransferase n=1 Tax=Thioflexithrix psekupsensis TaxID=1570016 RepID=A0A251X9I0_9GAMM|nr:nicotinate-nucleotide adenylyltransferase [Thioflexithrix psekupsensis]OUD14595.1 hypothetical protein TPSD3_09945 [Thioflexithrix psekupsensis]
MQNNPSNVKPIGLLGGTFDPIHHGHLRLALELYERLELAEVRLLPAASPPHKNQPMADGQLRLAMVQAAVAGVTGLVADGRELKRTGRSYTIDTLIDVRNEIGTEQALYLMMGMDAFMNLNTWHRWRELLDFAHLLVVRRPGALQPLSHELQEWFRAHQAHPDEAKAHCATGTILSIDIPGLMISSTQIRALLAEGKNPRYLLPSSVLDLIEQYQLYR